MNIIPKLLIFFVAISPIFTIPYGVVMLMRHFKKQKQNKILNIIWLVILILFLLSVSVFIFLIFLASSMLNMG